MAGPTPPTLGEREEEVTPTHGPPVPISAKAVPAPAFAPRANALPSVVAPGQKKLRAFVGGLVTLGVLVAAAVVAAPTIAKKVLIEWLGKQGIRCEIGSVELGWKKATLEKVALSSNNVTWVNVTIQRVELTVDTSLNVTDAKLEVPELLIDGRFGDIRRELSRLGDASPPNLRPRRVTIENGSVIWSRIAGDDSKLSMIEGFGGVEPGASADSSSETKIKFRNTRFLLPVGEFGPWHSDFSDSSAGFVARTFFDGTETSHLTVTRDSRGISVEAIVAKMSNVAFGVPRSVLGVAIDESARLEGRLRLKLPDTGVAEGDGQMEVNGFQAAGAQGKLDVRASWQWAGVPTGPLRTTGVFSLAGWRGVLDGKTEIHDDLLRLDVNLLAGPRPCDRVLREPLANLNQLAPERAALDKAARQSPPPSQAGLVGEITADARELKSVVVRLSTTGKCTPLQTLFGVAGTAAGVK